MRGDDRALGDACSEIEDTIDTLGRGLRNLTEQFDEYVKLVDARLAEKDERIADLERELSWEKGAPHARA